jgi:GAF domain-containing protein
LNSAVRVQTEEIRAERDRLNTLYTITAEMSSTLDIDRVLARALELLAGAVGANLGTILLIDHQTETLFKRAELGRQIIEPEPVQAHTSHQGLAGWMIEHARAAGNRRRAGRPALGAPRPGSCHPRARRWPCLETSDDIQGLLFLYSDRPGVFNQDHLRLVMAATSQLATSISNAELYRYIREQADRLGEMVREQQVEASKSNSILEGVADGVVVSDEDGAIILFNSAAERILEIKRDRVLSRPIATLRGCIAAAGGADGRHQRWMENPASIRVGDYLSETLELEEKVVNVMLPRCTWATSSSGRCPCCATSPATSKSTG